MIHIRQIPRYDADVLVVGAGPGGASAATVLARAGYKVIMVDYQRFPRDKVCGDFVGPVAIRELFQLGVDKLLSFPQTNVVTEAKLFVDGQPLIGKNIPLFSGLPSYGRVIPRLQLDQLILDIALEEEIDFREGFKFVKYEQRPDGIQVICTHGKKEYSFFTRLLIGADGSSSAVSRALNGQKFPKESKILAVRAYYKDIKGPQDRADLFFTESSFPGYYWLFPTGNGGANVGVGMVLETIPPNPNHLKDLLNTLVTNDSSLRARLEGAKLEGKIVGWPLSTYDPSVRILDDRILTVGDAAGLINSLNGEGIQYALLSGRWAAESAIPLLENDLLSARDLLVFKERVETEIGADLALSRLIIQFIKNRNLNPIWLKMLEIIVARANVDSKYSDTAGGVLAGLAPANKVLLPDFLLKTIFQGAVSLGINGMEELVKGPENWLKRSLELLNFSSQLGNDLVGSPQMYAKWLNGLGKDFLTLGYHTTRSMKIKVQTTIPKRQKNEKAH